MVRDASCATRGSVFVQDEQSKSLTRTCALLQECARKDGCPGCAQAVWPTSKRPAWRCLSRLTGARACGARAKDVTPEPGHRASDCPNRSNAAAMGFAGLASQALQQYPLDVLGQPLAFLLSMKAATAGLTFSEHVAREDARQTTKFKKSCRKKPAA